MRIKSGWAGFVMSIALVASVACENASSPLDVHDVQSQSLEAAFQPPAQLGELSEAQLRAQLIATKQRACRTLGYAAGVIVSTGVLADVPPTISMLTGVPIDELEARETRTCQQLPGEQPDAEKATVVLLNEANTALWLVQIHLGAMDRVLIMEGHLRVHLVARARASRDGLGRSA